MKKIAIITVLIFFVSMMAVAEDLTKGEKLVKSLELVFDDQAMADDVFISWELNGDWDKFDYSFSQGTLEGNVFTIRAKEYKDFVNGHEGIALTVEGKSKTKEGEYVLYLTVMDKTEGLVFTKEELNADFRINYLLPPPPPLWKRLLILGIILALLALIIWLVLDITAKFPKGILQLGHNEVRLRGKKRISVKDELIKLGVSLPNGTDVVFVKKRFVSFQGPCIKETKNCTLVLYGSTLSKGSVIRPDEEIKGLTGSDGREIVIRYCI